MSNPPEQDQKTEAPTPKRRTDSAQKGDVLQSKELGTALVVLGGAAYLAVAGPLFIGALEGVLREGLRFDSADLRDFNPGMAFVRMALIVALPLAGLFLLTLIAAIGTPAMLGSLGFRTKALGFKGNKLNPIAGLKRIFGVQGLIELGKSIAKVVLLGSVGIWLLMREARGLVGLGSREMVPALSQVGATFILVILCMAGALALIALIDVPAQMFQRTKRLKMSRQEVKDESKQTDGSPELKNAIRRKQLETARGSVRAAMADATMVLTNPTHFAVALRYRPGLDAAPIVVARGRDVMAQAIRELAAENEVPMLSYPQLTRALYFTSRTGQVIREDLYMAVATVLAFVFNLDAAMASGAAQPSIAVPPEARFDTDGRRES